MTEALRDAPLSRTLSGEIADALAPTRTVTGHSLARAAAVAGSRRARVVAWAAGVLVACTGLAGGMAIRNRSAAAMRPPSPATLGTTEGTALAAILAVIAERGGRGVVHARVAERGERRGCRHRAVDEIVCNLDGRRARALCPSGAPSTEEARRDHAGLLSRALATLPRGRRPEGGESAPEAAFSSCQRQAYNPWMTRSALLFVFCWRVRQAVDYPRLGTSPDTAGPSGHDGGEGSGADAARGTTRWPHRPEPTRRLQDRTAAARRDGERSCRRRDRGPHGHGRTPTRRRRSRSSPTSCRR